MNLLRNGDRIGVMPWIALNAAAHTGHPGRGGEPTATFLRETTDGAPHEVRQAFAAEAGQTYSFAVCARAASLGWLNLVLWDAGEGDCGGQAWFDLAGARIGSAGLFGRGADALGVGMEEIGAGWFLCRLTCRVSAGASLGGYTARIRLGREDGVAAYIGDGAAGLLVAEAMVSARIPARTTLSRAQRWLFNTAVPAMRGWSDDPIGAAQETAMVAPTDPDGRSVRKSIRPVVTLLSPEFAVGYPEIVNAEIMHWGARHAMEESWTRSKFDARAVNLYRLRDAYVCDEGLVFDRDLNVVEQSISPFPDVLIERARHSLDAALAAGRMNYQPGPSVVCKRPASQNYGHYLVEMYSRACLARLLLGAHSVSGERPFYIYNRVSARMLDVVYQSFRQIGIGLDQMLICNNDPIRCEELFFFDGISDHGKYMSPLAVGALDMLAATVPPGRPRKLFVRRRADGRVMSNETEVIARLAAAGYEIIEPGAMSLQEQIAAFRGAHTVVGVLGAAMANITFCAPGTRVVIIAAGSYPDTFFWFISTIRELRYLEIRGDQVEDPENFKGNWEFSIREKDIAMLAGY